MREQASAAERWASVVVMYSVRSPQRSSCYVLSYVIASTLQGHFAIRVNEKCS